MTVITSRTLLGIHEKVGWCSFRFNSVVFPVFPKIVSLSSKPLFYFFFLTRKLTNHVWYLIWPDWKMQKLSQTIRHQKATSHYLSTNTTKIFSANSGSGLLRQEKKIAGRKISSRASWIANKNSNRQQASRESRLYRSSPVLTKRQKFNLRILLKDNFTEDWKLNGNWNS